MRIKHWMTPDPITVSPETPILDAKKIMKDKHIRRLPVVQNDKLVGIVTYRNIIEASPSAATSLSIHELNYLLVKLQVKDVMRKNPITVSPEDSVIDVILEGAKKGIGSFPVVSKGKLVGIVTETEVLNSLINIFGTRVDDELIHLKNVGSPDSTGVFRRICEIIESRGVPVLAIFALPSRDTAEYSIYVRVKTKEIAPITKDLEDAGFRYVSE